MCTGTIYGVTEHYFILPYIIVSRHVRLLFLLLSFTASWIILKLRHVSIV